MGGDVRDPKAGKEGGGGVGGCSEVFRV